MKYCTKCGAQIHDEAVVCIHCGNSMSKPPQAPKVASKYSYGKVPKCTHCGHVGQWKSGPTLRPVDWIVGAIFGLVFFIPGVVYLVTVAIIRSDPNRKEKICTKCGAQNLFTFDY